MIRLFTKDDLPEIIAVAKKAWRKIFQGFRQQLGEDLYAVMFENQYQDKAFQLTNFTAEFPDQCYVCIRNDKLVGFATFAFNRDLRVGLILNNAADPDSGEKGVGQEMYRAVLDRFRKEGMIVASVTTGADEGHAPARAAYQRAGFCKHLDSVNYLMRLDNDSELN